jgi:hypothetical protein
LLAYSEGFLVGSNYDDKDKYDEAFEIGKNYSLNFGKILGQIE